MTSDGFRPGKPRRLALYAKFGHSNAVSRHPKSGDGCHVPGRRGRVGFRREERAQVYRWATRRMSVATGRRQSAPWRHTMRVMMLKVFGIPR